MDSVGQVENDVCAAACVQMILSSMGLRNLDPRTQDVPFDGSIRSYHGPWIKGNPVGIACTINRFNTGGSTPPNTASPRKKFTVYRTATPYEACSLIVDGLYRYSSPSAVMVIGSTHWIVVNGADGWGSPTEGRAYSLETLLMTNPDNGYYGGDPHRRNPSQRGYRSERVTYADFLETYFTGCNDDNQTIHIYGDGCEFVIVTDSRAKANELLLLPPAELPVPPTIESINAAINTFMSSDIGRSMPGSRDGLPARVVKRGDRSHEYYCLVPLRISNDTLNVVRLDLQGRYLGNAVFEGDTRTFGDDHPQLELLDNPVRRSAAADVLVWNPSAESASPYNPFFVNPDGGPGRIVSLTGDSFQELRSRVTGEALALPEPKSLLSSAFLTSSEEGNASPEGERSTSQ